VTLSRLFERLLQLVPVLLGISVIVFAMISLTPGDPVQIMLGDQQASPQEIVLLRHDLGLDQPLPVRFLHFLANAAHGNFGMSFFHRRPVLNVIAERLPATIELTLAALVLAVAASVPLGMLAAVKRHTLLDRVISVTSLLGVSMPGFWVGILLILLFAVQWHFLPVSGRFGYEGNVPVITHLLLIDTLLGGRPREFLNALAHIAMPAFTLALPMAAVLTQVTRSSMMEALRADYIAFAEAKGLSRRRILMRHALKNAMIPAVTVAALETGSLLGGNMIVETVFGWPGVGRLVVQSIFNRDYPLVQAAVLLYAVTYVLLNFAADLLYTMLNPRVRL
jgi:peptide/nickel transport system permease protein